MTSSLTSWVDQYSKQFVDEIAILKIELYLFSLFLQSFLFNLLFKFILNYLRILWYWCLFDLRWSVCHDQVHIRFRQCLSWHLSYPLQRPSWIKSLRTYPTLTLIIHYRVLTCSLSCLAVFESSSDLTFTLISDITLITLTHVNLEYHTLLILLHRHRCNINLLLILVVHSLRNFMIPFQIGITV